MAYSHLLLDAFTKAGVHLGRRRIAIAKVSYDNLILNAACIRLALLLVAMALF